jgi:hypothetical protein
VQVTGPAMILLGPQFTARDAIAQLAEAERCRPLLRKAAG